MGSDMLELRQQILSHARYLLCHSGFHAQHRLPTAMSSTTLIPDDQADAAADKIQVVVFGYANDYTGAVMIGIAPAIEGAPAKEPELALRKLLTATCELLAMHMPKLGPKQRVIHGGGVFDEEYICAEVKAAKRKSIAYSSQGSA